MFDVFKIKDKPFALPLHEWDDWQNEAKRKYPIRYFLSETLPFFVSINYNKFVVKNIWKIKHRYIKKHQYNIIRLKELDPGYYDPDTRILYAMMQELCDLYDVYLEDVKKYGEQQYDNPDDPWKEAREKMKSVYDYWKFERPQLVQDEDFAVPDELIETLDSTFGVCGYISNPENTNDPTVIKWRKACEKSFRIQEKIKRKDKQHMRTIISILDYMWY